MVGTRGVGRSPAVLPRKREAKNLGKTGQGLPAASAVLPRKGAWAFLLAWVLGGRPAVLPRKGAVLGKTLLTARLQGPE
jgi:hypothetical protein